MKRIQLIFPVPPVYRSIHFQYAQPIQKVIVCQFVRFPFFSHIVLLFCCPSLSMLSWKEPPLTLSSSVTTRGSPRKILVSPLAAPSVPESFAFGLIPSSYLRGNMIGFCLKVPRRNLLWRIHTRFEVRTWTSMMFRIELRGWMVMMVVHVMSYLCRNSHPAGSGSPLGFQVVGNDHLHH